MASQIIGEMREASASVKKGNGNQLKFTSTWKFLVLTDSVNVSREEVLLGTPGLPVVGLIYGWINAMCVGNSCVRAAEPNYWHVTCEFETGTEDQKQDPSNPGSGTDFSGNPLPNPDPRTWLPVFEIDGIETRQKVLLTDNSNVPVRCVNSAKQLFADPLTETVSLCSFSFVQFEDPAQDITDILDRNDCVNLNDFAGRDNRTLKINVTAASLGYWGNFPAWRVSYKCTYDPENWDAKVIDAGPNQLDGTKLKPCMDKFNVFRVVGNLNGSGVQQDNDIDPVVLTFETYRAIAFEDFIRR